MKFFPPKFLPNFTKFTKKFKKKTPKTYPFLKKGWGNILRLVVKYAKFDKISNEKLKQFGGKNDVSKNEKFSLAPPPLYKCIVVLLAAATLILTACGGLNGDDGEKNIRINLPPIVSASGNSRALSGDRLPTLKTETRKYRVTVNGITREGTGSSYEFTLAVGIRATAIIECLNSNGDVIIRAVKDFTVSGGENSIDINLKNDGNEIIPSAPQPVPNQVTYSYGEADRHGGKSGLPSDPKTYSEGDSFTVDNGASMTWDHGNFAGYWEVSPQVLPEGETVDTTGYVDPAKKYQMPKGGVVLTAQWNKKSYSITYQTNEANSGGTPTQSVPGTSSVEALASANISSDTPPQVSTPTAIYTFTGWNTQAGGGGTAYRAGQQITMMTEDITLYAQWTSANVYTVTYNIGSGPTAADSGWVANDTYTVGTSPAITLPTLTATGYTFTGWQINGESNNRGGGTSYTPTADVTATAQWTLITYSITYNPDGGNVDTSFGATEFDVRTGSINLPQADGKTGYSFDYWKAADGTNVTGMGGEQLAALVPSGSTTLALTAQWTAIPYTITYDANGGGTNPGNTTFTVADSFVTFASSDTLSKTGYRFGCWETTTGTDVSNKTTPAELIPLITSGTTLTLRAKWEVNYKSDKANWEVGDIVLNNSSGTVLAIHPDVYTARDATTYGDGVAIVYKNENNKVYIVGKVHENNLLWCLGKADGYDKIDTLVTEMDNNTAGQLTFKTGTYTDGSTGLSKLQAVVGSDYSEANYPAWYWASNYGTRQALTGDLANNWYLPSLAELFDIWKANRDSSSAIENALTAVGGNAFGSEVYWSSSQNGFMDNYAYELGFSSGDSGLDDKIYSFYVCAVRQFTY